MFPFTFMSVQVVRCTTRDSMGTLQAQCLRVLCEHLPEVGHRSSRRPHFSPFAADACGAPSFAPRPPANVLS